jgi:hypothetical protein
MMRNTIILLSMVFVIVMSGCSTVDNQNPDGEGYVFEISKGRVLILNNVDPEDIGKKWNELFESYQGEAIWLSTKKSNLKVGHYVRYWIDGGVDDSFPQQASAKKIEIIKK